MNILIKLGIWSEGFKLQSIFPMSSGECLILQCPQVQTRVYFVQNVLNEGLVQRTLSKV